MRSKRLLAFLLAFCMVFAYFAPAASAVEGPADNTANSDLFVTEDKAATETTSSPKDNDLVITGEDAAQNSVPNLRDDPIDLGDAVVKNDEAEAEVQGEWEVNPIANPNVDLQKTEVPTCLEELKQVAELYSVDEVVRAFVIMEDPALAETYTSRSLVSASLEKQMIEKQNSVIAAIERTVLNGQKLSVRYQFTYLTNAFSIETEFANLEKIAMLNGVKAVFVAPTFSVCETVSNPNTAASGAMTGVHTVWENLGYTGEGMKIAVIDTGLDLDHPSFGALDADKVAGNDSYMDMDDIAAVLEDLNAYSRRSTITAKTLYRSTKVPFAFNYCDDNLTADHSSDYQGDHGTHVAGIAAANKIEGTTVVGMAPDAQIIVMKVFGANGGAYPDDIVAALEDAMTLGCDVVNASLGSPAGFSESGAEWLDSIYANLANQDIVACISAGNEGTSSYSNMWGTNLNRTTNPDNATIGSPSLYANVFSIASAENCEVATPFFTLGDGTQVFFNNDSYGYYYGYTTGMEPLIDEVLEYVVIDGLGNEEDYYDADGNSLVEGKVAVVYRGEINFGTKIYNAEMAGAVACIIANNSEDDIFNFMMNDTIGEDEEGNPIFSSIPTCLISMADGQVMADAEIKTLCVSKEPGARIAEGGQMSSFSSWGVSPDLRLVPDITGIGGNVYSCYDGGNYGLMSGTSMSSPQLAGITALVMQYLYEEYGDTLEPGDLSNLARAILMSTADPIISTDSGVEASPRQQGSGLVNAAEAVKTKAYLTMADGSRPKAELGDSKTGNYTFSFTIHNISNEAETYTLSSSLLTEDIVDYGIGEYFMAGQDVALSGAVTFDAADNTVTVAPGATANVTVTITLSDEDKAMFARYWENGGYVEGFVYLDNADEYGVDLNLPFLGFYGDWTQAPIMDTAYWYDNSFWGVDTADGWPEGDEYYHVMWTDLAGDDWVLGFNPYSGAYVDAEGNIVYDPANNSVSPNGDGIVDGLTEIYVSLLRNAKTLTFTYSDAETGEVYHVETIENNSKTMYRSSYGQVVPWLYSWYGEGMYDFSDANGAKLANDTKVLLTIDANVDYGTGGDHAIEIPITVDTQAPELLDAYQITEADGSHSLVIIVDDNVNVAAMFLMNRAGTQIYGVDYALTVGENGTCMATFNVDQLGTELMVCLGDYAGNESFFEITYTAAGDNLPELDTDLLYGYRTYDYYIESYSGYDYMFGWQAMNKPEDDANGYVWLEPMTNDYMEHYALTAAEYVGGKVFGVDAGYNFVVMDPGLWNRTTICNLGINVLDMTFDDSTDTMYLLCKDEYNDTYLYAVDLMTGALTQVAYLDYFYYAPYAITDDDNGTLYAIKYQGSNLYTLTAENEWTMTPVTDADGNNLVIYDSNGSKTRPNYQQSMTYVDGKIYWAYFYNSYYGPTGEIIAIDTADFSYTNHSMVTYYDFAGGYYFSDPEVVGLLAINETEYQLPEATALEGINLSSESLVMTPGQTASLSATPSPWNYTLGEVTWTSSDENVAAVVNGKVTAVGEGTAVITATSEGISAECSVIVVDTATSFNAYNYYSNDGYYGYMIEVDTGIMDYYLVEESPVDWLAGDYNGHDGYFYGYSEGGQFWRYDPETGKAVKLGDPIGTAPFDMAYDYSSGKMYAAMVYSSYWSSYSVLCEVDMNNGQLIEVYYLDWYAMMTLAADLEGNLYSITADGMLLKFSYVYDGWFEEYSWQPEIVMEGLGYMQYMQSMCYDYANDVLIWAYCEGGTLMWVDPVNGYAISLGDPTGAGLFEFVGMYTIPETLPELPEVAVDWVEAADMMMLVGAEKFPNVTIRPTNATSKNIAWTSSDSNVVAVTEDGFLKGVSTGTATISGTLNDTVSGESYELSFTVTVLPAADDIYGMVMTDLASMGGQFWERLYPVDPGNPDMLNFTDYVIYAEEYYDGKLYAYGYDPNDWSGAWQFFVMDPASYAILEQHEMDDSFPFVYDMTYDYTTSTMYCVAGAGSTDSDLYAVNMETGELVLLLATDEFFMSLTASPDGTLYAMEQSLMDEYDGSLANAQLYKIDPINGIVKWFADTGIQSNMLASMAYDYDTDYIYWTALAQSSSYTGGLCLIDPATGVATNLGSIGVAGAQVAGLYIISENFPEESEPALHGLVLDTSKTVVNVGTTVTISATTLPMNLGAEITWTSSDETAATVENGVVTGVAQGNAVITASAAYNGVTMTAECEVAVLAADAAFLTWNRTDMGWSAISRADYAVVENLTEGEELGVQSFAAVGNDVYGYDENGNLFQLNLETFERTLIGESVTETIIGNFMTANGLDAEEYPMDEFFKGEIRDMAYDEANDRMLILTGTLMYVEWWEGYGEFSEMYNGTSIYSVDLSTGEITEEYIFSDYTDVYGMTVDTEGTIYWYATFDDHVCSLNLETGECAEVVSLQTQSLYGEYGEGMHHTLYYDDLTGMLYMQFTSNGKYYRMLTIDPTTGALTAVDADGGQIYIGEVVRQGYYNVGDLFTGMAFVEIAAHMWDAGTVTKPVTCTEDGEIVYTCVNHENCTKTETLYATGHNYENGTCTNCGEADPDYVPVYEAEIKAANVSLDGSLNLTFKAILSDDLLAAEDVCMKFAFNGQIVAVPLSEAEYDATSGRYAFTVALAAKQMADEVVAQVYMGDTAIGEAKSYSIQKYAEAKINKADSSEELVAMAKAMLNYGAAAQVFFNYNVENLANVNLDEADKVLADVDASAYAHSIVGAEEGIKAKSASLDIASVTTIKVTFALTGDKSIDEYTFIVDGVEVEPVASDTEGLYYIEITDIVAKRLDDMHTVTVGGLTVNYYALSYVNQVLKNANSSEAKIEVVKALYYYNQAANAFFE